MLISTSALFYLKKVVFNVVKICVVCNAVVFGGLMVEDFEIPACFEPNKHPQDELWCGYNFKANVKPPF